MNPLGLLSLRTRLLVGLGVLIVATGATVTSALAAATPGSGAPLVTALEGANEVPAANDPQASGTALVRLNPGRGTVCFDISWSDVPGTVEHAHIHHAAAGVAGPVVVPLFNGSFAGTASDTGCVSASRDLIRAIINDPGAYYVNIHSSVFPAGAARGQLAHPGEDG
jgi:hypothetical protein